MRRWVLAAAAVMLSFGMRGAHAQQPGNTVTVKMGGFRGVEGLALVTLYDSEQNWLKMPKAVQVVRAQLKGPELSVELKDVKPGTYAVQVVHDENKNNKLDMRWLPYPKPTEGVGVSNDPENKAGAPKWEAAKFDVGSTSLSIKVTVRYVD
jgi:uncharacterized protein (DUF2141 family)